MSTLKVNTVLSATTPTVLISDGLSVSGVSTLTGGLKVGTAVTMSDNGNFGITGICTANTFVDNNGTISSPGPLFRAYLSTYQVVSDNTNTAIVFQTENFDTDSCYNTSNGRFTPNRAGYYLLTGQLQFSNSTGNYRYITRLLKNGTVVGRQDSWNDGSNGENHNRASTIVSANGSSDYFTVEAYQASGGNITITNADAGTYFESHFIRPL